MDTDSMAFAMVVGCTVVLMVVVLSWIVSGWFD